MTRYITLICILFSAFAGNAVAADTPPQDQVFEAKLKFTPGQIDRYRIETRAIGTMQFMPGMPAQKFSQLFAMDLEQHCIKVLEDGAALYEMRMPRVAMDMQIGPMRMSYASDAEQPSDRSNRSQAMVHTIFAAMTQIKFTAIIDPTGKAREIKGLSESMHKIQTDEAIMSKLSMADQQFMQTMAQQITDETFKEHFSNGAMALPQGKKRLGDSWEHDWETEIPMVATPMNMHAEYTLAGTETRDGKECIRVDCKMSTRKNDDKKPGQNKIGGVTVDLDMKMEKGLGKSWIDLETWGLIEVRSSQDMAIITTVTKPAKDNDSEPTTMKLNSKIRQTTRIGLMSEEEIRKADQPKPVASKTTATKPATN